MAKNVNDYALIIGIKDYPLYPDGSLANPINDAKDFAAWLCKTDGGNLPKSNCKVITSDAEKLSPGFTQIDDALEDLIIQTRNGNPRRLYLFFSGHGLGIQYNNAGLCLTRWSQGRMGMALSSADYLEYLVHSGVFTEVFMFLDCCRIRAYHKKFHAPTLSAYRAADESRSVRKFVAYACEHTTSAYEPSLNKGELAFSKADNNGYFTRALLEGLDGLAVKENSDEVTAYSLKKHLEYHTARLAKEKNHNQKAVCDTDFPLDNEPVLVSGVRPPTITVIITFSKAGHAKLEVPQGSGYVVIQEADVTPGARWELELAVGMYSLTADAGPPPHNFRIDLNQNSYHVEY